MSIGRLLDRAIHFYRTHFLTLVAFSAIFMVPYTIILGVLQLLSPSEFWDPLLVAPDSATANAVGLLALTATMGLNTVATFFLYPLQAVGIGIALRGFLFEDQPVSLRQILNEMRENLGSVLLTGLIGLGLSMIISFAMIILFFIFPVTLAIFTLFFFAFYLAMFVVLYEKVQGLDAVRRGWMLVRHNIWRVLGYMLVLGLLSFVMTFLFGGLLGLIGLGMMMLTDSNTWFALLESGVTALAGIFFVPLQLGVYALLYFDLRIRHEGLDVALTVAESAGEPLDLAKAPVDSGKALDGTSWRAIGILSGIYFLIFGLIILCVVGMVTASTMASSGVTF